MSENIKKKDVEDWVAEPLEIPSHWINADFSDVFETLSINELKIPQKDYMPAGDFPVVDQGAELIGGYTCDSSKVVTVDCPIIVFGDHTRCIKYINFDFAPGADGIKALKPYAPLNSKYLWYAAKILKLPNRGYSRHFSFLKKSKIPLAPLNEQKRIVAKIEELFSELDSGIESLKTAREQLKVYRQAVLKHAFEGKLTAPWRKKNKVSDSWMTVTVDDIGDISTGSTPSTKSPELYGNEYPFYKPTDLEAGFNVIEARDYLSLAGYESARRLPANSILVTCIGATIGKTGIIRRAGAFNQQINAIVPSPQFIPDFVYFQVIGPEFQEQIKTNYSQTTLPILNKSKFSRLPFVTCSEKEQAEIVERLKAQMSVIDKIEDEIETQLQKSQALRQSILKKAFSGQLVAQNPADEPASLLLERIRTEKSTPKPTAKKTKEKRRAA